MKKFLSITLIVCLGLSQCLIGCSSDGGSSSKALKIGYVDCFTGNSAPMGVPSREGIELAVEELNEAGGINGRKVELIALDDEANPAKSVTQATKLVQQDKVTAVITGSNSGTCNANKQVFFEANIPNVVAIGTMNNIIDPEHETFKTTFRTGANEGYMIEIMANRIVANGYKKIGVIADTSAYGQTAVETIKDIFGKHGINIVKIETHEVAAADLTAQVLSLRNADADFVYCYNLGADAALTCKTIRKLDWDVPIAGARGLNMQSFVDLVEGAGDGVIIPTDVDTTNPELIKFIEKYDAKYGKADNYMFAAMGYTAAQVLFEGLRRSDCKGGDDLLKALESIENMVTPLGHEGATISFNSEKHEGVDKNRTVYITVDNNKFVMFDNHPYQ